MNDNLYKEEALVLIKYNPDNKLYEINQEAVQLIKSIPAPIGIITVAGLYRTGKSYLLNRMLLNRQKGFGVGPTVQPCTKGLWVWGAPIKGQTAEGEMINVLIVDSEGIGALDEDQSHDTRVFSLAILLGSCFIYNSVGSIDENAIQNLSLVVNLTKHIQLNNSNDVDEKDINYQMYFPSFFWVIRDFSLQLVDSEGEQITPKEYLEKALKEVQGFSDETENKNRIRRLLTTFFQERECITLVRPLVNEENLQKLDQMELDQLRPEFFEQVMNFRKRILNKLKPKMLNGKLLNGEMLINLMNNYIAAINNGAIPNIENAWNYICKDECVKAVQQAYEMYDRTLKEILYQKIPTIQDEILHCHKLAKEAALEIYNKKAIGEISQEYHNQLIQKLKVKINQIKLQNEKESINVCNTFIQREFSSIERKLKINDYKSFAEFERDIKLFYQFLIEHGPKTVNRQTIFLDFLQKMINEGAQIFIKNLTSELDIQKNCAYEFQKKTEKELVEAKQEIQKEKNNLIQKITQLEKEKAELFMNESRNQELLKEIKEQKEKHEQDMVQQIQAEKTKSQELDKEMKLKFQKQDEAFKEKERQLLQFQSNYQKDKALLENKAKHFEGIVEEYQKKEKIMDTSILNTKTELNDQIKQLENKYQKQIKDLETNTKNLQEKIVELQEKLDAKNQELEKNKQLQQEKDLAGQKNMEEAQQNIQQLKQQINEMENQEKQNQECISAKLQEEIQLLNQKLVDSNKNLTTTSEQHKQKQIEVAKEKAILEQKLKFLESELADTKNQLSDAKKAHQDTLQALEMSNVEYQSKVDNKQILEMKENQMQQMHEIEEQYESKIKATSQQLDNALKDIQEMETKSNFMKTDYEREITGLKEKLSILEESKAKLEQQVVDLEENSNLNSKQVEDKYVVKITELEQIIEQMKLCMQSERQELQQKSEENLAQLKNMYELEKERLESRLVEEKEKSQKSYNGIVEEYENKLRETEQQYEEEIDNLKEDINAYEVQLSTMQSNYEHELDLKTKNTENLEKMLNETKESLQNNQVQANLQMEQQVAVFNQEKSHITARNEQLTSDLAKKDKEVMTLTQKKEQLESNLQKKEQQWESQKAEILSERTSLQEKIEESRNKLQTIQDEFMQKQINYERSLALSAQQNEFYRKKVEELQSNQEQSNQRNEERMKQQKLEWTQELNEKLLKLSEDKQNLEQKYNAQKKQSKESEQELSKNVSMLEKDKAIALEKLQNSETKLAELQEKYGSETENASKNLNQLKEQLSNERKKLQGENEKLRQQVIQLESEKYDLSSTFEREKVLWEGKFQFLEQQKEQAKVEQQESQKKFEQTLAHLQKQRANDPKGKDSNVTELISQLEKKYQSQIQELTDSHSVKYNESQEKIKRLEKELKQIQDKSLMEQHNKSANQIFLEKKLNELMESEKKYQQEIEKIKGERDAKQIEVQKKLDQERETTKVKFTELEEKYREAEKKRSCLIFEHEKEKAKWNLEKDHLVNSKNELQESVQKIEKKKDMLLRENERLKNDSKSTKRIQASNIGASFQLNISKNQGSDKKSPISSRGMLNLHTKERQSYNEYSLMNTSYDMGNKENQEDEVSFQNKENNNILTGLGLDKEKDQGSVNNPQNASNNNQNNNQGGFKSFYQMMQEKQGSQQITDKTNISQNTTQQATTE